MLLRDNGREAGGMFAQHRLYMAVRKSDCSAALHWWSQGSSTTFSVNTTSYKLHPLVNTTKEVNYHSK